MKQQSHDDALSALVAGFYDEQDQHLTPLRPKRGATSLNHPSSIVGVGRSAHGPAVFVNDSSARAAGYRWSARYADSPCEVVAMPRPQTLPLEVSPQWWGWKTPAYGELIGGKTFYRREDKAFGGASGGTLSVVAKDKRGALRAAGNVHCYAAQHGTVAPPEHHVLWEAEWKTPFADVTSWQQISTSRKHPNCMDFGVAAIRDDWEGDIRVGEILDIGRVVGLTDMKVGDIGLMNGATTGRREKAVIATDVVSRIAYTWTDPEEGEPVEGEFILSELIAFAGTRDAPASLPGDSGSPVAVRRGSELHLGGLIFAGNGANGFAFRPHGAFEKFGLTL